MPRIGVLLPGGSVSSSPRTKALLEGLRELGYVEGKTIAIEWKWGNDQVDTFSGLAADLVRSNVDVIVTGGTPAAKALKTTTQTIPIVWRSWAIRSQPDWWIISHVQAAMLPASASSHRN
jgi:putative tryptophan/tyrosine transport system substrate-binding protein